MAGPVGIAAGLIFLRFDFDGPRVILLLIPIIFCATPAAFSLDLPRPGQHTLVYLSSPGALLQSEDDVADRPVTFFIRLSADSTTDELIIVNDESVIIGGDGLQRGAVAAGMLSEPQIQFLGIPL